MQAAIIGYMLTVAMLIPASGWLADRFGTRNVFLFSIVLFAAGSLFCAGINLVIPDGYRADHSRHWRRLNGAGRPTGHLACIPQRRIPAGDVDGGDPRTDQPITRAIAWGLLVQHASWPWIF